MTTEQAYKELITALAGCTTVKDIENMVKQILNIDENHLFFNQIVDKLCVRADISTNSLDDAFEICLEYLTNLESKAVIRAFNGEGTGDLEQASIDIISYYDRMQSLSMMRFKKIMVQNGYVVGPSFKSTRILTNKISAIL